MAIEVNIYKAVSMSLVNRVGGSGSKWVELTVKESDGAKHEFNIFSDNQEEGLALFFGCKEE